MEKLTEKDIAEIIAENERLKNRLRYYAGEDLGGKKRDQTPTSVIEKYGNSPLMSFEFRERLGNIIRHWLFRYSAHVQEQYCVTRSKGVQKRRVNRLISIRELTEEEYRAYSSVFCEIVDLLEKHRISLCGEEGFTEDEHD